MISVSERNTVGNPSPPLLSAKGFPRCNPTAVLLSCEWLKALPMQMSVILRALGSLSGLLGASSGLGVRPRGLVRDTERHSDLHIAHSWCSDLLGVPEENAAVRA